MTSDLTISTDSLPTNSSAISVLRPLRVVFAGTPEFAAISLEALISQQDALNIDIVAVYSQPDRKAGRGQKLAASAVKQGALAHDIPVEQPATFKKSSEEGVAAREILQNYQPDVMVVAAYGLILPLGVLTIPTYGCLNIHGSLLPRWRGAAPIHRALLAGDAETGITIMQMDKGLDTGDMLYKVSCAIESDDSAASLHDKLAALGATAISTVLQELPYYQAQATAQDDNAANYAEKLIKTEGEIDWAQSAAHIERQIRGLTPWPGAYTFLDGQRVKILASLPVNDTQRTDKPAGTVISVGRKAILVACGVDNKVGHNDLQASTLAITTLQFAGSKPVSAEQICHGNQLNDGDQFTADIT
ncbi:methionyl-tRNA formyltransferase [Psychrobacter urativorans]|uniref:methionyl-tRNA formyltransferase n=1 Tax=Psychrobacter urativorans TaxID=45610 RepID=UPI000A029F93|nr:methionyl-tRNA formyltransferase [Psychrobacter urativorans]